jgi:TonB-linked SusC/RagA family outer membrane protein
MKKKLDLRVHQNPTLKKIIMELKIAILITVTGITNVLAGPSYGQVAKVSLDMKNTTLEMVMDEIEKQSEFYFVFNQKQIDVNRIVDVKANGRLITDVLPELFSGTNVSFAVLDRKILLTTEPLNNVSVTSSDKFQQQSVKGKVTDAANGEPMPGVNIQVKGSFIGTITGADGNYVISVADKNATLVFSFIGYVSQEIPLNGRTNLDVALATELTGLEEVVVVGYGTQKKATLSGSVSMVEGTKINEAPVTNISNSIAGRLPGVFATTTTGEPGKDNATIRVRGANTLGSNEALIVVDGIPGRSLTRIDPNTIESITVLKDVSAAIYGAQAANGVILITTKRGKTGAPRITANINQGFAQPTIIPRSLNAAEYATALNEINMYKGAAPRYTAEEIQKFSDGTDPWAYPNTDWFAETFKTWSSQNNANISASGGNENMRFFVNLGTKYQDSYYKNSATSYKQYDIQSNLDFSIDKNITVGVDLVGRLEDSNYPMGNNGTGDIFRMLMRGKPTDPAYWPNGLPGPDIEYGSNPVVITTNQTGFNKDQNYVVNSNFKLNIIIPWIKGLSLTGNTAIDKNFHFNKSFQKPWYLYSWDKKTYDADGVPVLVKGAKGVSDPNLNERMDIGQSILLNGIINYASKVGDDHQFNIMAGIEKRYGDSDYFTAYRRYFKSSSLPQLNLGGVPNMNTSGSASHFGRLHYFGRMNYNYKEKYLAEFIWRVDGSYIFPEDKRFGFFPGVSTGWRVSKENFWSGILPVVNDFKLRASYGKTGNDRISDYQYLTTYGFTTTAQNQVFNVNQEAIGLYETRIPNPNVTWEVANQADIGFDATLFKNFSITFDYFDNRRSNILWQRNASIPKSTGLTLPSENIGKVANRGVDFDISYRQQINDFSYNISFNTVYAKNKIVFWDEAPGAPDYQRSTGKPMNTILLYNVIGVFRDQGAVDSYPHWPGARPGDLIFEDVNGDNKIDANDKIRNDKSTLPTLQSGLGIDLHYKQISLSVFFQGAAGGARYILRESGEVGNYGKIYYDGRWTPDNIDAKKPRLYANSEYWAAYGTSNYNSYFLYRTDYARLKNIKLGYVLPTRLTEKWKMHEVEIYASGFNILTYSPHIKDYDPEDTSLSQINYPLSRIINLGLSGNF